ncbi:hypothetical protein ACFQ67_21160 [Streptomyces sp. NPDC056488]|uniref:hypothetical protein n=1 Tax=Streptomyces sp. NPDC056488 TaxID=3345836 RepID=UPI0036D14E73
MSAVAAVGAPSVNESVNGIASIPVGAVSVPAGEVRVRRQRVRVPMRLVWDPSYQDVALSVYVKVKALASRPEGCEARTETIASYLGLSAASVGRGMTQLRRRGRDGVVELRSERRTMPGGRGLSAVRTVRPMSPVEAFVWLPVAAAEDLTPRQLRVFALVAYAQVRGVALTEAELASSLRHYSGKRAGQALSVTAVSAVVDEVEAARWMTVQRRAGARGRNRYIAHDLAPEARPGVSAIAVAGVGEVTGTAVDSGSEGPASSQVGEGSGSQDGEGSLAYKESPRTDSPEDGRALFSSAVDEVQVRKGASPVENPAGDEAGAGWNEGGCALRAGGKSEPSSKKPVVEKRSSTDRGGRSSSYTGPQLAMSPGIYAVLEPVHHLLAKVTSVFVARQIAREVGRQIAAGTPAERLQHRLSTRLNGVMSDEIRDPGRWLLGVALPRWGCGYADCESGTIWRTRTACEVCAEIVQDKAAARERARRAAAGLCLQHGTRPGPSGRCGDCDLETGVARPADVPVRRAGQGPERGTCGECGVLIFMTGHALDDGLCKPCRQELHPQSVSTPRAVVVVAVPVQPGTGASAPAESVELVEEPGPRTCQGQEGSVPCTREALALRRFCRRHVVQGIAGVVA